ncbi:methylated-DNA--[protein]-cysteine S-methyltransferase [bacterium]|nr:methylated-DNA--[protein]-cysteine S-methyltransferase [bacterium]
MEYFYEKMKSPLGLLYIVCDKNTLKAIEFEHSWKEHKKNYQNHLIEKHTPISQKVIRQLEQYFNNKRSTFDVPVAPEGTEFQKKAWRILQSIPYGKTISYQEQAIKAGKKAAVRAIGAANGRNPIPIIIPCHRVIGKNGALTGYAGGLSIKEKLLNLEQV